MATSVLGRQLQNAAARVGRQLHPRRSITGKFVVATALLLASTVLAGLVGIWQVTTTVTTTSNHADLVFQGGILAIIVVGGAQILAMGLLRQSIVGGLRELETNTSEILEKGTHGTEFTTTRADEIGQVSWNVAEIQAELAEQVASIEALNRELTTVATTQSRTLAACSDGDLTRRMETDTGTPQYDTLALRFNEMMDQVETMVAEVSSFSRSVTTAAADAERQARTAETAAEQITESTQSISSEIHRQRDRVDSTADAIEDLVTEIDAIASVAEQVAAQSRAATRQTDAGGSAAEEALEELRMIREQTEKSVGEIKALSESVDEIGAILELISDLADRTDQLAVNTQIQTAQSGAGDGTTRLTDRIRRLSDDTDEAATEIEAKLEAIEQQTDDALEAIERTQTTVERGTETINTALGAFEEVHTAVNKTNKGVARIESASEVQSQRIEEVADATGDVQEIGNRTARETADVASTTDEQQETIETIARRVQRLSTTAQALDTHLDVFTIDQSKQERIQARIDQ